MDKLSVAKCLTDITKAVDRISREMEEPGTVCRGTTTIQVAIPSTDIYALFIEKGEFINGKVTVLLHSDKSFEGLPKDRQTKCTCIWDADDVSYQPNIDITMVLEG